MSENEPKLLSREESDALVLEHKAWAEGIARAVARAWKLDWKLDGMDGAAFEALIFCSRRYSPDRGVPFKSYSRKRVHESSTDAARASKGWKRGAGTNSRTERLARAVSADLINIFPELKSGLLPMEQNSGETTQGQRIAIQQLLIGASIVTTRQGIESATPSERLDYKRMVKKMVVLHAVHQDLIWKVYWEGTSLRKVAAGWNTDELNVIREHPVILKYLFKAIQKKSTEAPPKVRPGLRDTAKKMEDDNHEGAFLSFLRKYEDE